MTEKSIWRIKWMRRISTEQSLFEYSHSKHKWKKPVIYNSSLVQNHTIY